jgi:hypothetical protein
VSQTERVSIFLSYSHRDEALRDQLASHLKVLNRQGIITEWHDLEIRAGSIWRSEISEYFDNADIILLLISSDYLASDYVFDIEMKRAITRHEAGEAVVIPIILRACDWSSTPFSKLQVFPKNGKPITSWQDIDEAFLDIAKGISLAAQQIIEIRKSKPNVKFNIDTGDATIHGNQIGIQSDDFQQSEETSAAADPVTNAVQFSHPIYDVFVPSGVPTVTFVEPEKFADLKMALAHPGRGVVIEGPSGIGKTTALEKAIEQVSLNPIHRQKLGTPEKLSARKPDDVERMRSLQSWHSGVVVIDDFHRLDDDLSRSIADYLKYLADHQLVDRKLVIIGIPSTGKKLINIAFDLAVRIKTIKLGKVKDETLINMIGKGEKALNVLFTRKPEIAQAANGSLLIAQLLCYHLALQSNIEETQKKHQAISYSLDESISNALEEISPDLDELIRNFTLLGGRRDHTSVEILKELSIVDDGFLSFNQLKDNRSDLTKDIDNFINKKYLEGLYQSFPNIDRYLYFDNSVPALVIDDPRLTFYLLHTPTSRLARAAGKSQSNIRNKVFISYSHADAQIGVDSSSGLNLGYFDRLRNHLKPLEQEGLIDLWDDTKIKASSIWRQEIEKALSSSKLALLLISGNFLASDFIQNNELPPLLAAAKEGGTMIFPIIISPSRLPKSISEIQSVNSPSQPLTAMTYNEQEILFVKVVEEIENALCEE